MDTRLIVHRLWDVQVVFKILTEGTIWSDISEDGATVNIPDVSRDLYLGIWDGPTIVGMYKFNQLTSICWEVHTCIFKQYRKLAPSTVSFVYGWLLNNIANLQKIVSRIPETQRHVLQFALKAGLKKEGFNRNSYLKNGKIIGQHLVGITREEMITRLKGESLCQLYPQS